MGWMPAPLDISIWNSMWTVEKKKLDKTINHQQSRFDFNVGYLTTTIFSHSFSFLRRFSYVLAAENHSH